MLSNNSVRFRERIWKITRDIYLHFQGQVADGLEDPTKPNQWLNLFKQDGDVPEHPEVHAFRQLWVFAPNQTQGSAWTSTRAIETYLSFEEAINQICLTSAYRTDSDDVPLSINYFGWVYQTLISTQVDGSNQVSWDALVWWNVE